MRIKPIDFLFLLFMTGILCFFVLFLKGEEYYMVSFCILAFILLAFFIGLEHKARFRDLMMIAVMSSVAVAARVALFFLPQGKPLLAIVMITGIALGPFAGFTTGASAVFLSNFYFGQGSFTPFQMVAAGLCGYFCGLIFQNREKEKGPIVLFGLLATIFLYGGIVDLNTIFLTSREPTWELALTTYAVALPFNLIQGIATGIYLFFLYHPLLKKLNRVKIKYGLE